MLVIRPPVFRFKYRFPFSNDALYFSETGRSISEADRFVSESRPAISGAAPSVSEAGLPVSVAPLPFSETGCSFRMGSPVSGLPEGMGIAKRDSLYFQPVTLEWTKSDPQICGWT